MSKDTSGPAFPVTDYSHLSESKGMSLRDYFAAKAMQGMLAAAENYQNDELAEYAYLVADAMLNARDK